MTELFCIECQRVVAIVGPDIYDGFFCPDCKSLIYQRPA